MADELVKHMGGCHCGAIRFEVLAPSVIHVYDCKYEIQSLIYLAQMFPYYFFLMSLVDISCHSLYNFTLLVAAFVLRNTIFTSLFQIANLS